MRSMFGRACDASIMDVRVRKTHASRPLTSVHASNYIVGRVSRIVRAGDVRAFHVWTCVRISSTSFHCFDERACVQLYCWACVAHRPCRRRACVP